ncbi:protein canopy homolog 2-like [Ostrea edulis]|uniref:protein canopy homolog 2-like n=1 Tax=Ostrea edulis TaxID=37623 RepID=UPI0024AE93FA|nr:protein canopy homolog 2-like [Ostrea edulis]
MDLHLLFISLISFLTVESKRDDELYCAVCRALVDEVNYSISTVNSKQKVQVGSFRVDSKGNQKVVEVPLARSEVHLTEVFETICEKFRSYGNTKNALGKKGIVRMVSRDGKPLVLKDIHITMEGMKLLTHTCETIAEEYEDQIIRAFRHGELEEVERKVCGELAEYCSEEDLNTPMPEPGPVQESQEVKDKEKEEEGGEDETDDGIEEENDKEEDTGSKEEL